MNEQKVKKTNTIEPGGAVTSAFDWVGAAVVALTVVAILFSLFFRVVKVSGDSMCDTLVSGEKLLLTAIITNPDYGDIVVITQENDEPLIKRVIGLPGDTIFINNNEGIVYRNGQPLDEPYVRGGYTSSGVQTSAVTVPEGCVYVLGDNRSISKDSRSPQVGCPSMKNVVGVVTFRLAPFESLRNGD